jgi:hypothetical protein
LSGRERATLDALVKALLVNSDWRLVIEADGGREEAENVSRYLVRQGIDEGRLTAIGADSSGADPSGSDPSVATPSGSDPSGGKTGAGGEDAGVGIRLDFSGLDLTGLEPQAGALVD